MAKQGCLGSSCRVGKVLLHKGKPISAKYALPKALLFGLHLDELMLSLACASGVPQTEKSTVEPTRFNSQSAMPCCAL